MSTSSHDFVTVDMRGLKAALVALAEERRCSVSFIVRGAVKRELGQGVEDPGTPALVTPARADVAWVKLSVRVTPDEVNRIDAAAQSSGLSRGAYLSGLAAGVPVLLKGGNRSELVRSLVASCSVLAKLSRNIHQLGELLHLGNVEAAQEYKRSLDGIDANVAQHLHVASRVLAELRPSRAREQRSEPRPSSRRRPWEKD